MSYYLLLITLGLLMGLVLCHTYPRLNAGPIPPAIRVTVIIPARNEERSLPLLLGDLMKQTVKAYEIICVDDASTDQTARAARKYPVKLISLKDKPSDWTGKAWACQTGGREARGELLLFLDADVRLAPDAIAKLLSTYQQYGCVLSVQPYHRMEKPYEQFSLFFNILQYTSSGMGLPAGWKRIGLYGPVILIRKETYRSIGGHTAAKSSIVDDMALAEKLSQTGREYKLFAGGEDISFRMYGGGFRYLWQGWTKNFATGAAKTPPLLFLSVFLWVTSCISAPLCLLLALVRLDLTAAAVYLFAYSLWVLELRAVSRRLGSFSVWSVIGYPAYLAVFLWAFFVSAVKKGLHRKVLWKDRQIELEK